MTDDVVIGKVFMQGRASHTAQQVLFSHMGEPLLELKDPEAAVGHNIGYITFVLLPRQSNANAQDNTINLIHTFPDYLHYHIKCSKPYIHTLCSVCETSDFLKELNCACPDAKKKENNHGEDVTFGNWKRKQLATEGWNTCYRIIVAFNVVPLQVLKGFSVLVPFCICLESNLQNQAVLARTSWFPRIKKQKKLFHLINLIPCLYLCSLTPLSLPLFSKLFCFAVCYW